MTNTSNPKISVYILSYNFNRYLDECIQSVLDQSLQPYEIIISDDHSTDNSWSIIKHYQNQNSSLIKAYRHDKNIGMQKNVNLCINKTKGDIVSWLDGDDRWHPNKLEMEWEALRKHPEAHIAYSNVRVIDEDGNPKNNWYDNSGHPPPSGDIFFQTFSRRIFPNTSSVFRNEMVYRSVYDEIGMVDEEIDIFIDFDFKLRATSKFLATYSGKLLVDYRYHDQGIHNSPEETLNRSAMHVYKKNLQLLSARTEPEAIELKNTIERQIMQWESKNGTIY